MTDLAEAYASTSVEFAGFPLEGVLLVPGPTGETGVWPFGRTDVAWIITAENPLSKRRSDEQNADRMAELDGVLDDPALTVIACVGIGQPGQDGTIWSESSRLVIGLSEERVRALAQRFEQKAVFRWTPHALEVVGVLVEMHRASGWTLDPGSDMTPS